MDQKISDSGLARLSELKRLESLSLYKCPVSGKGLRALELPRLREIRIGPKNVNEQLTGCLNFKNLRIVDVGGSDLADSGLKKLLDVQRLEELDISNCKQSKGQRWTDLAKLKKLKRIKASSTVFLPSGLETILELTSLRELGLSYAKYSVDPSSALARFKRLVSLDLSRSNIPEENWEFLSKLKKLEHLSIKSCPHVTDATIEIIAQLPALQSLELEGTSVSSKSESSLAGMTTLRRINLRQTKVSRASQDRLDKLFESRWPSDDDDD